MSDARPDPLVPAEVDLRGYEFMPLYGDRLFKSETWIGGSPEAKIAALRLWWQAYAHETPAGSLPDSDTLLADYAGYGVALKAWQRVKPQAMRGWVQCSDGRLYHKVVCEIVMTAWAERVKAREKGKAGAAKRWGAGGSTANATATKPDGPSNGTGNARAIASDRTGQDRTGNNGAGGPATSAPDRPRAVALAMLVIKLENDRGKAPRITSIDPRVIAWAERGVTDSQVTEAHRLAVADRTAKEDDGPINAGFLDIFVAKVLNLGNGQSRVTVAEKPWFINGWPALEEKAKELKVEPWDERKEHAPVFRARVLKAAGITPEMVKQAEADYR